MSTPVAQKRPRTGRTVAKPGAKALKPAQIDAIYNIPPSSLHFYCATLEPADERLPSMMLPGKKGRKATRLVKVTDLETWLARHQVRAAS